MRQAKKQIVLLSLALILAFGIGAPVETAANTENTVLWGDLNFDGEVDILDVTLLRLYVAGRTVAFPTPTPEITPTPTPIPPTPTPTPTPPPTPGPGYEVGQTIPFGGRDWLVLDVDVEENRVLIISENIIEQRQYQHTAVTAVTWETSSLRQYLNNEFFNSFNTADRARILETYVVNNDNPWTWTWPDWGLPNNTPGGNNTTDRIFLLSLEEVVRYFGDSGMLEAGKDIANRTNPPWPEWGVHDWGFHDQYSDARIALTDAGTDSWWWLRSPGNASHGAAFVFAFGSVNLDGTNVFVNGGVRPAFWLSLES